MATGISLHIGLNSVDPSHYAGWSGDLSGCEADAQDMCALAKARKFQTSTLLLTKDVTAKAVTDAIAGAAKKLQKDDLFFLTYSGHGGQVKDTNGDEVDGLDETWVCHDRELIDDELFDLWHRFQPGVRVLVLSDSCHSGTVTRVLPPNRDLTQRYRVMPPSVARAVQDQHADLYKRIQDQHPTGDEIPIGASVLLISGCMDNQFSRDGDKNGLFTETLKKVWNNGAFNFGYRRFRDAIASQMPADQTPNYSIIGALNKSFEKQQPFTI